ncbi:hypothetical protein GCK72_002953 [Caenorhabditis remanei]|uniref:Sdz-33 F-box domain-containing protein n=1 Tax=Caenorhabditis remanei TaxID=31234 RepID=A0A6A5HT74_CAERE|nr:hypothetical protein GCK72_002953 [Caenorhabditis remanei]KAF1771128.1 hypothetical protein GCK72_002953 [Caenorhabditis remanei]
MERIDLAVNNIITVRLDSKEGSPSSMVWSFYPQEDSPGPIPVYMPSRVTGMITERSFVEYQNPGLSIQKWIEHFQYIFSIEEINYLSFADETCKFDWISLKDAFGKFKILTIFFHDLCSLECAQMALRYFPSARNVTPFNSNFNDPSRYSNILIQNWDLLVLGVEVFMSLRIGLDDLLLMNSKDITIESPTLTDKMVNQFFKHWIRGSNPRMELARFVFVNGQVVNKEIVLKGLQYQVVTMDPIEGEGEEEVEGYDIRRNDGTVGTISIEQTDQGCDVYFQIFEQF